MTLDGLAKEMATEFGEQYGDLDVAAQFKAWTQEVYEEVATQARWFWKNGTYDLVLVDGQAVYALPTTVSEVRAAYTLTTPPINVAYCTVERLRARGETVGASGSPQAWFYAGIDPTTTAAKVQLWPVPNSTAAGSTIRMEVVNRPTVLAASDTIPLPQEYIAVMREGIRARMKFNDNDLQGYEAARTLFENQLSALNHRFNGADEGGSSLRVKRSKATRQAPAATEVG